MAEDTKRVFISYSSAKRDMVREITDKLRSNGVDAIIDVYRLKPGTDLYKFMESMVNDPSIDYVLMMCDVTYVDKCNKREGGAGCEACIISPEIYNGEKKEKFIPVVIEHDENDKPCCPTYAKSKMYIDLSDPQTFEREFDRLLRHIYDVPYEKEPALGKRPKFTQDTLVDLYTLRTYLAYVKKTSVPYFNQSFVYECNNVLKGYLSHPHTSEESYLTVLDATKEFCHLIVSYFAELLIKNVDVSDAYYSFLESFAKDVETEMDDGYGYEIIKFLRWELFLSFVATYLYLSDYKGLHNFLNHSFFIYDDGSLKSGNYVLFNECCELLNETDPKFFSYQAEYLLSREFLPYVSAETIYDADLVLYEVSPIFKSKGRMWIPKTYHLRNRRILHWEKLESRAHCSKILPLFELNSIEELKEYIKNHFEDNNIGYQNHWRTIPRIRDSISISKIGTIR